MAYTENNFPSAKSSLSKSDGLKLDILNALLKGSLGSNFLDAQDELTIPVATYGTNKAIEPSGGNQYLEFDSQNNGYTVSLRNIIVESEDNSFLPQLKIIFFNAAGPIQANNTDFAMTYAQSASKIGELVLEAPTALGDIGTVNENANWIDLKCIDGDSKIYYKLVTPSGVALGADKKLRIKALGIVSYA